MKPGDEDEEVVRDHPQDFDAHDLDGNIDALNHSNDGNWDATRQAELLQKLLNEERSLDRVKSGEWGSAKVEMADPMALINLRINRYR
jgi:hypothetical protein